MRVAKWEHRDAYSVGIPSGACGGRAGRFTARPTVSPVANVFFWLVNGLFIFLEGSCMDAAYWPC